ncbi:MAG: ABC transporter permease [SAR202 cluster bacterium]|jgi:peptide/nickel transport system permease protein|nr:ABC transporter permease [SAR202 cluster bacterium]|tara:strand:- start:4259 stop:5161 length:903 start_codon:yes stop_codon:yes gene_type:complete
MNKNQTSTSAWIKPPDLTIKDRVKGLLSLLKRHPNMAVGISIFLFAVVIAIFAPLLWTSDPSMPAPLDRFTGPWTAGHWFGTDNIGRDIWSRALYGSRISLTVGVSVAIIAISAGTIIGVAAGYSQKFDMVVMRFMDGLMSIPSIILAIALMALLGGSVQNVIIALSVTEIPIATRVVRSAVLSLRERTYIEASRSIGATTPRIMIRHILPNIVAPLIVHATYVASAAVLLEAYLSFLGAGPPEEIPSWGNMVAGAKDYLSRAPYMIIFPGLFLTFTVLGMSLSGDGLRDILDPKIKRRS